MTRVRAAAASDVNKDQQDDQYVGRQCRQELLAQPAVDGRQQFIGVDQQQQPLAPVGQVGDHAGVWRQL